MKIYLNQKEKETIEELGFLYVNAVQIKEILLNKGYKIEYMKRINSFRISKEDLS